jgi:hypothetical protein
MNKETTAVRSPQDQAFPETGLAGYLPVGRKSRPLEEPKPAGAAVIAAFEGTLARLEDIIDQETAALEAHQPTDLADFNRRKSTSLLELSRIMRSLPSKLDKVVNARLQRLREKLERNQAVIMLHLTAVGEISDLLVGALGEADSDGTYGMAARKREGAR